MNKLLPWLATASLLFATGSAVAVNKCTDPKTGQVTYSDAPCASGAVKAAPPDLRANLVDGNPDGERRLREDAMRSARVRELVERGQVAIGMTEGELLASRGQPIVVNTSTYAHGTTKQWVFGGSGTATQYVYTEGGVVTAIQHRPSVSVGSYAGRGDRPDAGCYSEQAIRNAHTSASSITLTPERRREMLDQIGKMRPC